MFRNQRRNPTLYLGIILVITLFLAFLSISHLAGYPLKLPDKKNDLSTQQTLTSNSTSTPPPVQDNSIKFDVEEVKVGDSIGSMKIVKLRGYKTDHATADSAFVDFSGKISLKGDVEYLKTGQLGELVCMKNFDQTSQAKLPKLTSQYYVELSFCFTNTDLAKKLLVKDQNNFNQGIATVTIDQYKIQWYPIEIHNTATLISTTKK